MPPRGLFMGTPDFAVPALERLAESRHCEIALVVTQPDRRAGRGNKMVSPAVKTVADRLALPVVQTSTLRDADVRQRIIDIKPDLVVVAAFGMILGKWILELPTHGCINLHASLLPKYRGANPIASAIADGATETGVSLMHMDRGLDTGPVYATTTVSILPGDTTESLTPKLAVAAADILDANLMLLVEGSIEAVPQGSGASLTRMMTKDDGWLDFSRSAVELERHVRAMWPWPRAWTTSASDERIQVHESEMGPDVSREPGTITHHGKQILVATNEGSLSIKRAQLPGRRPLDARALLQHAVFAQGSILGKSGAPDHFPPLIVPADE